MWSHVIFARFYPDFLVSFFRSLLFFFFRSNLINHKLLLVVKRKDWGAVLIKQWNKMKCLHLMWANVLYARRKKNDLLLAFYFPFQRMERPLFGWVSFIFFLCTMYVPLAKNLNLNAFLYISPFTLSSHFRNIFFLYYLSLTFTFTISLNEEFFHSKIFPFWLLFVASNFESIQRFSTIPYVQSYARGNRSWHDTTLDLVNDHNWWASAHFHT